MNKNNIIKLSIILGIVSCIILIIGALIIWGTAPLAQEYKFDSQNPYNTVNYNSMPPLSTFTLPDQTSICYREYPASVDKIMLYIHDAAGSSRNMHVIADYMSRHNKAHGIALDMRGHGCSGERGKIDYIGQLEDDVAAIIKILRAKYPQKRISMTGFSAGGGFAIRFAGSDYGDLANSYVFLTPFLHQSSPVVKPPSPENEGQRASAYTPRIIGITLMNLFGITWFNNLAIMEYRIPDIFSEDYTAEYSFNLYDNFRPHKDYIGDIRNLKQRAVLFAGEKDQEVFVHEYINELEKYTKRLSFEFLPNADHLDMVLDKNVIKSIAAKLP